MLNTVVERMAKLIDVKSIMTLSLTFAFVALTMHGNVPQEFLTVYTAVTCYYFGVQHTKNKPQ